MRRRSPFTKSAMLILTISRMIFQQQYTHYRSYNISLIDAEKKRYKELYKRFISLFRFSNKKAQQKPTKLKILPILRILQFFYYYPQII